MGEQAGVAALLRHSAHIAQAVPGTVAAVLLVGTVGYTFADVIPDARASVSGYLVMAFVQLYLQLLVTARALVACGLAPPNRDSRRPTMGRYPSAVALNFFYVLGVLAGALLLVVPGIVLFLRWSVALPAMLAEEEGITDALARSWQLTRRRWPLLLPYGGIVIASELAAMALIYLVYPDDGPPAFATAVLANAFFALVLLVGWLMTVSLYARVRDGSTRGSGTAQG